MNSPERLSFKKRLQVYSVIVFFAALVSLPILSQALQGERARWQAAVAVNRVQHGQGDVEKSTDVLLQAASLNLNDDHAMFGIAQVLLDHGHAEEALELAEVVSENPEMQYAGNNLMVRSLNHLGRFNDSLVVYKSIAKQLKEFEDSQDSTASWLDGLVGTTDTLLQVRSQRLNGLAYHQALAGQELSLAQDNIEEVIDGLSAQLWLPVKARISFVERTMISIALIGRQVDRSQDVLDLLDRYLARLESASDAQEAEMLETVNDELSLDFPFSRKVEKSIRQRAVAYRLGRERIATLLVVRALILDDLGQLARCDQDRFEVTEMGIDPDQVVQEFPDDIECLRTLEQAATYLDTRGVVKLKQGKLTSANQDFDLAITAIEVLNQSFAGGIQNSVMNEGGRFFRESRSRELEASVLYHRMQLAEEMDDQEKVDDDRRRIEELGFKPGPWLN